MKEQDWTKSPITLAILLFTIGVLMNTLKHWNDKVEYSEKGIMYKDSVCFHWWAQTEKGGGWYHTKEQADSFVKYGIVTGRY